MRQDKLDCELAVSHLQDCCPSLDARQMDCFYEQDCGGSEPDTYPIFTIAQSQCLRDQSCSTLVSGGVCSRLNAIAASTDTQVWQSSQVCP